MPITKEKFAEWFKTQPLSVTEERGYAIFDSLNSLPNGERLFRQAIEYNMEASELEARIGRMKEDQMPQTSKPVTLLPPLPVGTTSGPVKKSAFLGKVKNLFVKKEKTAPNSGNSIPGQRLSKKPSKKMLLIGGGVLALLVVVVVISLLFPSDRSKDVSFTISPTETQITEPTEEITIQEEAPPSFVAKPLDLKNNDWFGSLQILLLVEAIGIVLALFGDASYRKQLLDFFVPFFAALAVIFVSGGQSFGSWGILLAAIIALALVSLNGGKDFSPVATFLILIGTVGGIIFNRMTAIETAFKISQSQILPITQMGILFTLRSWGEFLFPFVVYILLLAGLIISLIESVRPSEDNNPRWGTVGGGLLGVAVYFLFFYLVPAMPAWTCYVVAAGIALGLAAVSQNERVIRTITSKWGVRSIFDSVTLLTAVLLVLQLFTGHAALFK